MAESSWVEDPTESTPVRPYPRSKGLGLEHERIRKRDVEGCTSKPPPEQQSNRNVDSELPPKQLLSTGCRCVDNKEAAVSE